MSKKDNARKFLWDDDGDSAARSRQSVPGRTFSTRDYAVDQSVNLMDMGDKPATPPSGGGVFGLFRGVSGAAAGPDERPPRFDEYGDAAPSTESEEYISDKRRRNSPLWAALCNGTQKCIDSCVMCFGRLDAKGMISICLVLLGIILLIVMLTAEVQPVREKEIQGAIMAAGITSKESFTIINGVKSPQREALHWIVHQDPAQLSHTDDAMLERYVLAVFYFGTNGPREGWKNGDNWMTEKGYCSWYGVECLPREQEPTEENNFEPTTKKYDDNAPITGIKLADNKMEGIVPAEFAGLESAMTLDFQMNEMSGDLPPALTNMKSLRALLLRKNNFVGTIHKDLTELVNLHELHLGENRFEGTIPTQLNNMKELRSLGLNQNMFTGTIPNLDQLTKLLRLYLDDNDLSGTIPSYFQEFKNLLELRMSMNKFSGTLGTEFKSLVDLEVLQLNDNKFTGSIPNSFDHSLRMSDINLKNNQLSGKIPKSITHLVGLKSLRLDNNVLTGPLDPAFGLLPDISFLSVNNNQLTGSIPTIIGLLDDIVYLTLSNNKFTGVIPSELGTCFRLETMRLDGNQLSGEIPTELGKLDGMTTLKLEFNNFDGITIPPQLCSLRKDDLTHLSADCNEKVTCDCCNQCA